MLFDTSIWIDFLNGRSTNNVELLQSNIANDKPVIICPPIYQEILQGVRDEYRFAEIKDLLMSIDFLYLDGFFAAEGAAQLYRSIRKRGVTINKPNDCLISFYAIHFNIKLVHNDTDFEKIAKHSTLKLYTT